MVTCLPIADSTENVKQSCIEAVKKQLREQLREIKKLCRELPKTFNHKGKEIQYKFNAKSTQPAAHVLTSSTIFVMIVHIVGFLTY